MSEVNNNLSKEYQQIVAIAAFTAKGDLTELKEELAVGLDEGLTINQIKEVLIHTYAYCGFPRSIRGLQTFMEVLEERETQGINDVIGDNSSPITDIRSRYDRGKEILDILLGSPQEAPSTGYAVFAPQIEIFLKEHLFADLFERDVLTYAERELVTVSVIAAIGDADPLLRSHLNICLNMGLTPIQLQQFVNIIDLKIGGDKASSTQLVVNEVLAEYNKGKSEIFPQGELIDNDYFTGTAWHERLVTDIDNFDVTVGNVVFEAGARNNWHSHPGGQILICISGEGFYQEKGKPAQRMIKGDVVEILPNVVHWHGATHDSS